MIRLGEQIRNRREKLNIQINDLAPLPAGADLQSVSVQSTSLHKLLLISFQYQLNPIQTLAKSINRIYYLSDVNL
jgi:hypothetical protein